MTTLFETVSLGKYYRARSLDEVRALDGVSLTIEQGSFSVLTGPSGSGKTTLLALLGALERPSHGRILFAGKNLADCSDVELARVRRRMGFVFQDFSLIPNLSAEDNITYPLIPRGVERSERQRRAVALLSRFGLAGKLHSRGKELSGGEQQRVAIARALAGQPEVVLADEPTSNLDLETGQVLLNAFRELPLEGTTVVLASHDPRIISLATHVYELVKGKLQPGPPGNDQRFCSPASSEPR
jgi:putative ABC transport system ATP-binding protein